MLFAFHVLFIQCSSRLDLCEHCSLQPDLRGSPTAILHLLIDARVTIHEVTRFCDMASCEPTMWSSLLLKIALLLVNDPLKSGHDSSYSDDGHMQHGAACPHRTQLKRLQTHIHLPHESLHPLMQRSHRLGAPISALSLLRRQAPDRLFSTNAAVEMWGFKKGDYVLALAL